MQTTTISLPPDERLEMQSQLVVKEVGVRLHRLEALRSYRRQLEEAANDAKANLKSNETEIRKVLDEIAHIRKGNVSFQTTIAVEA